MDCEAMTAISQVLILYKLWLRIRERTTQQDVAEEKTCSASASVPSPLPPNKKARPDSTDVTNGGSSATAVRPKRVACLEAMERNRAICRWLNDVKKAQRMQGKPPTKRRVIEESDQSETEDKDAERYAVDELLDEQIRDGKRFLLVRWVGYALPTWEPLENIDDCGEILRTFNEDVDPGFESD